VGIEIRLLGRFAVVRDGHEVAPAAFRQSLARRLVRILASRRGEFVSRDFLFESLWPGAAPADPGANLRVLVTLARKALGDPALIRAASGGYVFSPDDLCSVDSEDFLARLAVAGRFLERESYREALDAFRDALMLWTGEPLAEDAFDDWAHPFRSRLSLAHLHALEGAAEAALMAGNAVDAAGWAEQAALLEPLRERSNALLIEALAASGDTAKALSAYESFRQLAAEELGLDPSPETQMLQVRILRGNVRAEASQPAGPKEPPFPRQLAFACSKPFAGRAEEVEIARRILAKPKDRAGFLWIVGEPGIGKTTLAALLAQRAHSQGAVVLFGRCTEDFDLPYQPFLEALEWYLLHVPSADLGERPEELVRLVPEIADRIPGLQAAVSRGPEMDQHRLSEAVLSWLAAAGRGLPVVMFIDDVQWADRSTIALLAHLARSSEPSTVWVICTAREPCSEDGLAILNEQIARNLVPSYRLELSGLEPADVEELVVQAVGRSLDFRLGPFVDELHRSTAGNPLFIDSLLRDLAPDTGRLEHGGSIAESVTRRVSRLPGDVRTCLDAASVGGVEFDLSIVAQACGMDDMRTLRALEEGIRAALIGEVAANRYRFRHAVVRSVLLQQLSESRRVRLHLVVAEALEGMHRDHLPQASEALAMHFTEALPVGGADKAYTYTLMAAGEADRLLSHDQVVRSYDRALGLLDRVDRGPLERYELLVSKSRAQRRAGDMLGALESLREAIREAELHRALPQLAGAAVEFEDANFWLGSPENESVRILSPVCERMEQTDAPLRARLLAALARALEHTGEPEAAADRAQEAAAMAERLGDPRTSYEVNLRAARSSTTVAEVHLRSPAWQQLARLAQRLGDTDGYMLALGQAMWAEAMLGNLPAAGTLFAEYSAAALELRQPRWDCWVEMFSALRSTLDGRLDSAEHHLRRAESIGESFGWARPGLYGVAMFFVRREQGRLGEVAPVVRAAARLNPADAFWRPGLAALYLELGLEQDARREFDDLVPNFGNLPDDGDRELSLAMLAETAAGLGDAGSAGWLFNELLDCRGRLMIFLLSAVCLGPADRLLGLMASVAGDHQAAREWFESALGLARRIESPVWVAHTLHDYLVHERPVDETAVVRMRVEAAALCETYGLVALGERVDRLMNP
jgi:DNA-binding SARP family transcriptional activator